MRSRSKLRGEDPRFPQRDSSLVWRWCPDWESWFAGDTPSPGQPQCPRDESCPFLHLSRESGFDVRLAASTEMCRLLRDSYQDLDKVRARQSEVCLYFARGESCEAGWNCENSHVVPRIDDLKDIRQDLWLGVASGTEDASPPSGGAHESSDHRGQRPLSSHPRNVNGTNLRSVMAGNATSRGQPDKSDAILQEPSEMCESTTSRERLVEKVGPVDEPGREAVSRTGKDASRNSMKRVAESAGSAGDASMMKERWTTCTFFEKKRKCWHGNQCWRFHGGGPNGLDRRPQREKEMRMDLKRVTEDESGHGGSGLMVPSHLRATYKTANGGPSLCPFFLKGSCDFGEKCLRVHPSPVHFAGGPEDFRRRRPPPSLQCKDSAKPNLDDYSVRPLVRDAFGPRDLEHLASKSTLEWSVERLEEGVGLNYRCSLCDAKLTAATIDAHLNGRKHAEKIASLQRNNNMHVKFVGGPPDRNGRGEKLLRNVESGHVVATAAGQSPSDNRKQNESASERREQQKLSMNAKEKLKDKLKEPTDDQQEDPLIRKLRLSFIVPNPMKFAEERMDCLVCDTFLTGFDPALSHMNGEKHRRQVTCAMAGRRAERKRKTQSEYKSGSVAGGTENSHRVWGCNSTEPDRRGKITDDGRRRETASEPVGLTSLSGIPNLLRSLSTSVKDEPNVVERYDSKRFPDPTESKACNSGNGDLGSRVTNIPQTGNSGAISPKPELLLEEPDAKKLRTTRGWTYSPEAVLSSVHEWRRQSPEKVGQMLMTVRALLVRARLGLRDPRPRPDLATEVRYLETLQNALTSNFEIEESVEVPVQ